MPQLYACNSGGTAVDGAVVQLSPEPGCNRFHASQRALAALGTMRENKRQAGTGNGHHGGYRTQEVYGTSIPRFWVGNKI